MARGRLISFEGLDQSGKQTQAEAVHRHLEGSGRACQLVSFPDYATAIGAEIRRALHGERDYPSDVMQLLYIANRYEVRGTLEAWLAAGTTVVCDRYLASSIAYGEAQGLDSAWLADAQKYLPRADLTVLLDIAPETAVRRKATGRDRYERDLELLARVRESYLRQAQVHGWTIVDGEGAPADVSRAVLTALERLPAPR